MASIEEVEARVKVMAERVFGVSRCMVRSHNNTLILDVWPEGESIATYSFDYTGYVNETRSGVFMNCDVPLNAAAYMIVKAMFYFLAEQE